MNEKFNNNAKVEKLAKKMGKGVRLIVIGPLPATAINFKMVYTSKYLSFILYIGFFAEFNGLWTIAHEGTWSQGFRSTVDWYVTFERIKKV